MGATSKATGLVALAAALALGFGSPRQADAASRGGFHMSVGFGQPTYSYGTYVQPYYQPYPQVYYVPTYVPVYPTYGYSTWQVRPSFRPHYRPHWRRNHHHGHGRRHR